MGAAHSRARPGTGPTKGPRFSKNSMIRGGSTNQEDMNDGYFILCLKNGDKTDKIKVVNASGSIHKLLTPIIRRNMVIAKSGWDRHLVFSYKLEKSPRGRHALIQVRKSHFNRESILEVLKTDLLLLLRLMIHTKSWACYCKGPHWHYLRLNKLIIC